MGKKRKRKKKKKNGSTRRRSYHRLILFILSILAVPIVLYFLRKDEVVPKVGRKRSNKIPKGASETFIPQGRKNRIPTIGISGREEHSFNRWNVLEDWERNEFRLLKGDGVNIVYVEYDADIFFLEGKRYDKTRDCFETKMDSTCGVHPYQSVNILPFERVFTNKNEPNESNDARFFTTIVSEYSANPGFTKTFFPMTFEVFHDEEREAFLAYFNSVLDDDDAGCEEDDLTCEEDPEIWMRKSGWKKSLIDPNSLSLVAEDLTQPKSIRMFKAEKFVMQKYVHNPLTIGGKKCSFRQYILVASLEPLLVLTFNDVSVSCAKKNYYLESIDYFRDPGFHVTDGKLQKTLFGESVPLLNFEMTENELKKRNESGQLYIMEEGETFRDDFNTKMNRIAAFTIKTFRNYVFDKLGKKDTFDFFGPKRDEVPHFYGLYGVDALMDEDGAVWVSELEYLVDFDLTDPVKKRLLKSLAREMMHIVNEVQIVRNEFRHNENGSKKLEDEYRKRLVELKSVKNFMWVIQGDVEHYHVPPPKDVINNIIT